MQKSPVQSTDNAPTKARITIFGVGAREAELMHFMRQKNMDGVEFYEVDEQHQAKDKKWQQAIQNLDMVIIVTSIGNDAISTALCIAQATKKIEILTIVIPTHPFSLEQQSSNKLAEGSIAKLCHAADSVISIPNQQALSMRSDLSDPGGMAQHQDIVLLTIKALTDLVFVDTDHIPDKCLLGIWLYDFIPIYKESNECRIGIGYADGDGRALVATRRAIDDHLLMKFLPYSKGWMINFTGGHDMTLQEIDEATTFVHDMAHEDANYAFGAIFDEKLDGKMRVTIAITGINFF
jgi:cell division protein FtsZ